MAKRAPARATWAVVPVLLGVGTAAVGVPAAGSSGEHPAARPSAAGIGPLEPPGPAPAEHLGADSVAVLAGDATAPGLAPDLARGRVVTGATPHRLVLFTFDDGPDVWNTTRLLDSLDREGVKAVFFLTASRLLGTSRRQRRQIQVAREIVRRGHSVGSHTLDHEQLPTLSTPEVLRQVREAEDVFVRVLGARPWLLRPPGGARSTRVDEIIEDRGYTMVLWNLGAGDVQVETPEDVLDTWRRVFDRRERERGDGGGIVLLHDLHDRSVEAFSLILDDLRRRNCRLLEKDEELYDVVDDLALFFEPRWPGDPPGAHARPAMPDPEVLRARQRRLREATRARCAEERRRRRSQAG